MSQSFEEYVAEWDLLVAQIETVKKSLKVLTDAEMPQRKAIAQSVETALGDRWQEGVNKYTLPNGRFLKVTNKIERKIDMTEIQLARDEFALANDVPADMVFDDLLRPKFELVLTMFKKLEGAAAKAASRVVITKVAAPTVVLD